MWQDVRQWSSARIRVVFPGKTGDIDLPARGPWEGFVKVGHADDDIDAYSASTIAQGLAIIGRTN
jgi:hypothetical protein